MLDFIADVNQGKFHFVKTDSGVEWAQSTRLVDVAVPKKVASEDDLMLRSGRLQAIREKLTPVKKMIDELCAAWSAGNLEAALEVKARMTHSSTMQLILDASNFVS